MDNRLRQSIWEPSHSTKDEVSSDRHSVGTIRGTGRDVQDRNGVVGAINYPFEI